MESRSRNEELKTPSTHSKFNTITVTVIALFLFYLKSSYHVSVLSIWCSIFYFRSRLRLKKLGALDLCFD